MTQDTEERGAAMVGDMAAPVSAILDEVAREARRDRVSVDALFSALGRASYTPLLLLPALAVVSPLSGIPGFSSVCGITIAIVAMQMIARRPHVWMPRWVRARKLDGAAVRRAANWLRKPGRRLERATRPRLTPLVSQPLVLVPEAMCLVAGLLMPVFELVPFLSSFLGTSVVFLGVAMLVRDGLLALLGLLPFLAGIALASGVIL